MTSAPAIPDTPLAIDLPCAKCHYNLRTKKPSELCPECAHPVAKSIPRWQENFVVLDQPRNAALAVYLLSALSLTLGVRYLTGPLHHQDYDLILYFARATLLAVASILLANSEKPRLLVRNGRFFRIILITAACASQILPMLLGLLNMAITQLIFSPSWREINSFLNELCRSPAIFFDALNCIFLTTLISFLLRIAWVVRSFGLSIVGIILLAPILLIPLAHMVSDSLGFRIMRTSAAHPTINNLTDAIFDFRGPIYLLAGFYLLVLASRLRTYHQSP